jgi:hypothetical protein
MEQKWKEGGKLVMKGALLWLSLQEGTLARAPLYPEYSLTQEPQSKGHFLSGSSRAEDCCMPKKNKIC